MNHLGIDLSKLNYSFVKKPILVGGKAMEYYELRKSGDDIDFIVCEEDIRNLVKIYPNRVKDLWADFGVCPFEFEIWRTICYLKYEDLLEESIQTDEFFVISKKNLLLMKALAMKEEKYLKDTQMIVESMLNDIGKKFDLERKAVDEMISRIDGIIYIEKIGPEV